LCAAALAPALHAQTSSAPSTEVQPAPGDWPRYARDLGGTRFSPLQDIDTANVAQLEQAWSFTLRPDGGASLLGGTVPVVIDGIMYLPLGNAVVAVEGHTGKELWRHPVQGGLVRRGVTYWGGDGTLSPRLFYATGGGVTALNVATGEVDTAFGQNGSIKIEGTPASYPPTIYKNVMLL